jgi:hypothetical protein
MSQMTWERALEIREEIRTARRKRLYGPLNVGESRRREILKTYRLLVKRGVRSMQDVVGKSPSYHAWHDFGPVRAGLLDEATKSPADWCAMFPNIPADPAPWNGQFDFDPEALGSLLDAPATTSNNNGGKSNGKE